MWESTLTLEEKVIIAGRDVLSQSMGRHKKKLSEVLEHRVLLISIIDEFEVDMKQAYSDESMPKTRVQKLQQEHMKLVQSLESLEEHICSYTAKTKTEQRLVALTVLDVFIRLNDIDGKDDHIQCLIGRIKAL